MKSPPQCTIFGDGKQTRDYVFVGDVVRAHLFALENNSGSETFNISTGIETDVNQLFSMLSEILTNSKAKPQFAASRKGEQERSVCSYAKAEKMLGWKPNVDLDVGLRRTVEYFQTAQA